MGDTFGLETIVAVGMGIWGRNVKYKRKGTRFEAAAIVAKK
ncbi:MAG: hypothetical protein NVV72_15360 [Asticcacaulis sp.]|nr:hypothetical protein [Asticcacaulis sp.]